MWVYVEDVDEDIGRLLLQDWVVTSMIGHRELPMSENLSNQAKRLT